MARKKFAIRSLFATRPAKTAGDEPLEHASDSDDLNDAHPFDPTEVNRPPKLDDRTEAELRKACARVVEHLKPSGHDLEDTRMQSDILVDNPDVNLTRAGFPAKQSSGGPPQPDATWYLEESSRSSQYVNPRNVVKSPEKRGSTYRISGIGADNHLQSDPLSKSVGPQESIKIRPIESSESPRAPLASAALPSTNLASPLPKQVSNVKSISEQQNGSSSSVANSAFSDNPQLASSSTQTSTNYTPSSTSKRTSDNFKADATSAAASATTGPWMKQEVDKRMMAEKQAKNLPSKRDSTISTDDTTMQESTYAEAQAIHIKHRSGNIITSSQNRSSHLLAGPEITSGTLSGPFDQPQYQQTNGLTESNTTTPTEKRQSKVERQDSAQLAEDYQKSILLENKLVSDEDGSIAAAKARASGTNSRRVSTLVNRTTSISSQRSDGSKRLSKGPTSPISPTLPKSAPSWPAPPKPALSETEIPSIPPLPNKHQYDESIVVKDFYQPPGLQKLRHYVRPTNSQQPGDVEAADFDSIMSVVKESRPNTAASKVDPSGKATSTQKALPKPSDNPSVANTSRPVSASEPATIKRDQETPTIVPVPPTNTTMNGDVKDQNYSRPQSKRLSTPNSNPRPLSHHPVQSEPQTKEEDPPVLSPPIPSPRQIQVSSPAVVSSSRTSISASMPASPHSRSASTSKRGLKRFLSKLGNADRAPPYVNGYLPARRKYIEGFAPGAYVPGHGINGGIAENDEWFDEQACAAPVVGFGRGW